MVDHLMNSTRRVQILAPHTDDAELENAGITPVYSPFSHSHYHVHTEWAIGGAAITMARWQGYGDPIVTHLRPWDRFCPQVLQSSVQHKVANIWPDKDPVFWSSADVQEILAAVPAMWR